MLAVLEYSFNAVAPILLLSLFGYILKRKGFLKKDWLKTSNQFMFRCFLPILLFQNVYSVGSLRDIDWGSAGFIIFALVCVTLISLATVSLCTKEQRRKGVLAQNAFRSNNAIIGIPLSEALQINGAAALLSAMQAPSIIYFNAISVVVLSIFSEGKKANVKNILIGITKNPLIRGIVLGIVALCIREFIPRNADGTLVFSLQNNLPFLYTMLSYLARMATPMALIVLGGQFEFSAVKTVRKELTIGVLTRLVISPAFCFALAFLFQAFGLLKLTPQLIAVMISIFSTPVAVSSAVMAQEMDGDEVLAGQLVVWSTLFSLLTLFLQIAAFRYFGMLG